MFFKINNFVFFVILISIILLGWHKEILQIFF